MTAWFLLDSCVCTFYLVVMNWWFWLAKQFQSVSGFLCVNICENFWKKKKRKNGSFVIIFLFPDWLKAHPEEKEIKFREKINTNLEIYIGRVSVPKNCCGLLISCDFIKKTSKNIYLWCCRKYINCVIWCCASVLHLQIVFIRHHSR